MKRLKFQEFSLNWYRIISLIFAVVIIVVGSGIFADYNSIALVVFGFILIIFDLSRFFWYRNNVKWNSKVIYIRINSVLGKKFKFNTVDKVKVTTEHMIISANNTKHTIDLYQIDRNDIDDLADIIIDNSDAEYDSEVMHEKFYK